MVVASFTSSTDSMPPTRRSAEILAERLKSDEALRQAISVNPTSIDGALRDAMRSADEVNLGQRRSFALEQDVKVYRLTVWFLGIEMVAVVGSIAAIAVIQVYKATDPANVNINVPDGLIALGSAAVGALAGLLAPIGGRS